MFNFILFSSAHCCILAHSIRDVSAKLKLTGALIVRSSAYPVRDVIVELNLTGALIVRSLANLISRLLGLTAY